MIRQSISSCFGVSADGAAMETQGTPQSSCLISLFLLHAYFFFHSSIWIVRFVDAATRLFLLRVPREFCNIVRSSLTMLTNNVASNGNSMRLVASVLSVNGSARTAKLATMARLKKEYRGKSARNKAFSSKGDDALRTMMQELQSRLAVIQNIDWCIDSKSRSTAVLLARVKPLLGACKLVMLEGFFNSIEQQFCSLGRMDSVCEDLVILVAPQRRHFEFFYFGSPTTSNRQTVPPAAIIFCVSWCVVDVTCRRLFVGSFPQLLILRNTPFRPWRTSRGVRLTTTWYMIVSTFRLLQNRIIIQHTSMQEQRKLESWRCSASVLTPKSHKYA